MQVHTLNGSERNNQQATINDFYRANQNMLSDRELERLRCTTQVLQTQVEVLEQAIGGGDAFQMRQSWVDSELKREDGFSKQSPTAFEFLYVRARQYGEITRKEFRNDSTFTSPLYVFLAGSDGGLDDEPTTGIIAECKIKKRDLVVIFNNKSDTGNSEQIGWDSQLGYLIYGWDERCKEVNKVVSENTGRDIVLAGFSNGGGALTFGLEKKIIDLPQHVKAVEIICPWMVNTLVNAILPGKPVQLQGPDHFKPIQKAFISMRAVTQDQERINRIKMLVISSPQDSGPNESDHPTPSNPKSVTINQLDTPYSSTDLEDAWTAEMKRFDKDLITAEKNALTVQEGDVDTVPIVWIKQEPIPTETNRIETCRQHSDYCGTYCGRPRVNLYRAVLRDGLIEERPPTLILPGFMGIVKTSLEYKNIILES